MGGCINKRIPSLAHIIDNKTETERVKTSYSFNQICQNDNKISQEYQIWKDVIGEGAYGEVRKATHLISGETRAVKIIYRNHLSMLYQEKLIKEITILKRMDHPNIVKVYEYFQDKNIFYIVMEMIPGGELFKKIQEVNRFPENEAAFMFYQLMSAVNYMHQQEVVHRDLKPENILFDDNRIIKLIDFGTSKKFKHGKRMKHIIGSPFYMAPEVFEKSYTEKCDIWSAGIILFILLIGYPPFNGSNDQEVAKAIKENTLRLYLSEFDHISPSAKDLLSRMLAKKDVNRISSNDVVHHRWFRDVMEEDSKAIQRSIFINLQNFSLTNPLERVVYLYLINNMITKEEKQELSECFNQIDQNKDGVIDTPELLAAFRKGGYLHLTEKDIEDILDNIDINRSRTIDYTEFLAAAINRHQVASLDKLQRCFNLLDKEGRGKIPISDLSVIFKGSFKPDDPTWQVYIPIERLGDLDELDVETFSNLMMNILKPTEATQTKQFFKGVQK